MVRPAVGAGGTFFGMEDAGEVSFSTSVRIAKKVQSLHADFHGAVAHVLELAVAGKTKEAEEAMRKGEQFAEVSSHLVQALMEWKGMLSR